MAAGERVEPHVGDFAPGMTFTRWYWQIELDGDLRPTGRDILPDGFAAAAHRLDRLRAASRRSRRGRARAR